MAHLSKINLLKIAATKQDNPFIDFDAVIKTARANKVVIDQDTPAENVIPFVHYLELVPPGTTDDYITEQLARYFQQPMHQEADPGQEDAHSLRADQDLDIDRDPGKIT